jgi:hypothetical protein
MSLEHTMASILQQSRHPSPLTPTSILLPIYTHSRTSRKLTAQSRQRPPPPPAVDSCISPPGIA